MIFFFRILFVYLKANFFDKFINRLEHKKRESCSMFDNQSLTLYEFALFFVLLLSLFLFYLFIFWIKQ